MAQRRMFSRSITESARFLRMPPSSRLLYYDLGMSADDDGIVEAFTVIRTTGAAEDDLRVLVAKGFVRVLNEDLVSFIVDWRQNNEIKKDRYRPSVYHELLVQIQDGTILEPEWIQNGTTLEPQVRLGESRREEGSLEQDNLESAGDPRPARTPFLPPAVEEVQAYFTKQNLSGDPGQFFDYYQAGGWVKTNGQPVKDWQAAARSWARREENQFGGRQSSTTDRPAPVAIVTGDLMPDGTPARRWVYENGGGEVNT